MLAIERRNQIRNIILEKKNVTVQSLSVLFSVSTETIRRDLDLLETDGVIIKTYGGATLKNHVKALVSTKDLSTIFVDSKRRMARSIASHIKPNDSIFIDHSTTAFELCPLIEHLPITVISHSLRVLEYLSGKDNIQLICPGGNLNNKLNAFFGLETLAFLKKHSFDKAFLSCRTIDLKKGLCDAEEFSAEVRSIVVKNSTTSYVLADQTKFDRSAFVTICPVRDISYVVTDFKLSGQWTRMLDDFGVRYLESTEKARLPELALKG